MFNSAILDTVIGMVFVYLLLALMCSAASEMIELWLKNRATDLERGLRELLKDPNGDQLVEKIYQHPLVNGLFAGDYDPNTMSMSRRLLGKVNLPSYIPSQAFALALLDIVLPAQPNAPGGTAGTTSPPGGSTSPPTSALASLRASLNNLGNPQVEQALRSLLDAADDSVTRARLNIEKWFDASMDRVSGWYKRRSQVIVFVLGFVVSVGVNADSVLIAKRLSADKSLRESVVSAAQNYAKADAEGNKAEPSHSPTKQTEPSAKPSPTATPAPPNSAATANASTSPASTPKPGATPAKPKASPPNTKEEASVSATPNEQPVECNKTPNAPQCKFEDSLNQLKSLSLPIGWDSEVEGQQFPGWRIWREGAPSRWAEQIRLHIFGWLLTALAISLGAPFWFDMLNKLIVVRSTVKPKEKSPEEKSKDK